MTKRKIMMIMSIMIALALFSTATLALGVSPVKSELPYEQGKTYGLKLNILNNENKNMKVIVYTEGESKELLDIEPMIIELKASESVKTLHFNVDMTNKLEKAGTNTIRIMVKEVPPDYDEGAGLTSIEASVEVIHKVEIHVPYPGRYIEADIIAQVNDPHAAHDFTLPIYNKGSDDLTIIRAEINVFDAFTNKKMATTKTDYISLKSGKEGKLTANLDKDIGRGKFRAEVEIQYDEKRLNLKKDFYSGTPSVDIISVTVDKFRLGSIAKFDIWVENNWNQKLDDVFIEMFITNSNGQEVGSIKTATTSIESKEIEKLEAYWDTSETQPEEHLVKLLLHYSGLIKEHTLRMQVGLDSIKLFGLDATRAIAGGEQSSRFARENLNFILLLAIVVLLVIILIILLKKRKKIKKREEYIGRDGTKKEKQETIQHFKSWETEKKG